MKRLAISILRTCIHAVLLPLEWLLGRGQAKPDIALASAPIFIIGAPRSGTSLLYELLITRFRFAYISNLSHRFYLTPVASTWVGRSLINKWRGNFESRYGHIEGWGAPNEGGWVWKRWLDDGDWTDGADFEEASIPPLRRLVGGLTATMGAPFLNKNVMHSNRLLLMQRIWPNAIYIHVRRDFADNARSIIRAERKEGGPEHDADNWWSVRPSNAPDHLRGDDVERAAAQVVGVEADIAQDHARLAVDRMLSVDYAKMCAAPRNAMQEIADFLRSHGVELQKRGDIPTVFSPPPSKPLADAEEARMQELLAQMGERLDQTT